MQLNENQVHNNECLEINIGWNNVGERNISAKSILQKRRNSYCSASNINHNNSSFEHDRPKTQNKLNYVINVLQEPFTRTMRRSKGNRERSNSLPLISVPELCPDVNLDESWINDRSETIDFCGEPRSKFFTDLDKHDMIAHRRSEGRTSLNVSAIADGDYKYMSTEISNPCYVDIFTYDKHFHVDEGGWVELASEMEHKSTLKKLLDRSRNIFRNRKMHDEYYEGH